MKKFWNILFSLNIGGLILYVNNNLSYTNVTLLFLNFCALIVMGWNILPFTYIYIFFRVVHQKSSFHS